MKIQNTEQRSAPILQYYVTADGEEATDALVMVASTEPDEKLMLKSFMACKKSAGKQICATWMTGTSGRRHNISGFDFLRLTSCSSCQFCDSEGALRGFKAEYSIGLAFELTERMRRC